MPRLPRWIASDAGAHYYQRVLFLRKPLESAVNRTAPTAERSPFRTLLSKICYSQVTMSAINGDKARFHRERKSKLARRERSQALRKKITPRTPARPGR